MQLQQPVGKTRSEESQKQKPQLAFREPLNPNQGVIKVSGHPVLAPIDLQTIGRDLISAQFVYLYKLPLVKIEPKTLVTAIKGFKRTIDKTYKVELNWRGYEETRMFNVAHLSGCDMIIAKHGLQNVRASISAGTVPVTIQPPGIDRFQLHM